METTAQLPGYADYDLIQPLDRTGLFPKTSDHDTYIFFVDAFIDGYINGYACWDLARTGKILY